MRARTSLIAAATAAATALALTLVTAPAAQAFQEPQATGFSGQAVDLTDIVRITPDKDGKQIAPTLQQGKQGQAVPDLQIKLPIKTEATASVAGKQFATWQPGDVLTVTLPAGVTFAATPKVASSDLTDLANGESATAALVSDSGAAVQLQKPSMTISADKSVARILITGSQWGGVDAQAQQAEWLNLKSASFTDQGGAAAKQPGFLLTVSGLKVSVAPNAVGTVTATVAGDASNGFYGKPEYSTYPAQAPAACTVGTVGGTRNASYVGGTTTLGFLPPLSITAKQVTGQALSASLELQQLPSVTVSGSFTSGAAYQLTATVMQAGTTAGAVLFDFPAHQPPIAYMDAVLTTSGAVKGVSLAPSAGQYSTTRAASLTLTTATGGGGAVGIGGLRVAGYVPSGQTGAVALPAGATVRLSAAPSTATNLAVNDTATVGCLTKPGASTFSVVQSPTSANVPRAATADLAVAETSNRVGGLNRYDTAARLALRWAAAPGQGKPTAVVIANGETGKGGFDALSANYLAGQVDAPILLTMAKSLPRETAQALRAVLDGAGNVTLYVMGKADSVADQVVSDVTTIAKQAVTGTVTAQRVAGSNRFATSVEAADVGTVGAVSFAADSPKYTTALLTSGLVNADALAAGPMSYSLGLPVLLTGGGALPVDVVAFIKAQKIQQVFVLGGTDRVTRDQLAQLRALGVKVVKRIAGANRFATSADLYSFATSAAATMAAKGGGLGWTSTAPAYVANGVSGFPDALAVGPLAGASRSALVTTGPTKLDPSVAALLKTLTGPKAAIGLGSAVSVPVGVLAAANAVVG